MTITPGIYSNRKQKRYVNKEPNENLVKAIEAVVPKSESIIDLGAGCGWFVKRLRRDGWKCDGVDGTPGIFELSEGTVEEMDLLNLAYELDGYQWGLFSDVGEHVPKEFEQQLIDNICKIPRKGLIISWGYPHERGYQHVNLRTQVWVAAEFAKRGWWPDDELTQLARDTSRFPRHHIRLFVVRRKKMGQRLIMVCDWCGRPPNGDSPDYVARMKCSCDCCNECQIKLQKITWKGDPVICDNHPDSNLVCNSGYQLVGCKDRK